QVAPERLLDDDARVLGAARLAETLDHGREQARRDGQVVRGSLRVDVVQCGADRLERLGVAVVPVHVPHRLAERLERVPVVDAAPVLLDAVMGALAQVVDTPARRRHADHGDAQVAPLRHRVERGEDLLVREVSGRPEEDKRVRARGFGGLHHCPFSTCPPNSRRMAERSLSAKSASPRELNRSYSEVVMTWAGTLSSMAAITVQRPSPESDTRPANSASCGDLCNASAVRSSSHDATTLPRRHTSATSGMSRSYW